MPTKMSSRQPARKPRAWKKTFLTLKVTLAGSISFPYFIGTKSLPADTPRRVQMWLADLSHPLRLEILADARCPSHQLRSHQEWLRDPIHHRQQRRSVPA
jgi:hypothetical protein